VTRRGLDEAMHPLSRSIQQATFFIPKELRERSEQLSRRLGVVLDRCTWASQDWSPRSLRWPLPNWSLDIQPRPCNTVLLWFAGGAAPVMVLRSAQARYRNRFLMCSQMLLISSGAALGRVTGQ